MKRILFFAVALMIGVLSSTALSQTQTPRIDKREHQQKMRIREGVRSGELTRREARKLRAEQAKIRAHEARAKVDSKVTPAERRKLNRELDRSSRHIYRSKHNNRTRK